MKRVVLFLIFCSLYALEAHKKFVILIASYNNEQYVNGNLLSALQNYPNECYRIIYINDCSTDNTLKLVQDFIALTNTQHLITLIDNPIRMGALYNHWRVINTLLDDDEIVVILDGDDQLADNFVLTYLNNDIYINDDIWMTYGQYREINSQEIGFNQPIPKKIVLRNKFRKHPNIPSHLRTFYAKLYKNIHTEDLMLNGDFFEMCADMATGIPMIEMARDHFKFIDKVLYLYNDTNPISDHKKSRRLQQALDKHIRKLPVYEPLEALFDS